MKGRVSRHAQSSPSRRAWRILNHVVELGAPVHDVLARATTEPGKGAPPSGLPFTRADIEQTVPARFAQVVRRFPDHVALTGKGRQWTYRDLDGRANWIAHAIRERARPGSGCVAYLVDHSPEMVIATLAVLKAGKTYLAIYPAMPGREAGRNRTGRGAGTHSDNRRP